MKKIEFVTIHEFGGATFRLDGSLCMDYVGEDGIERVLELKLAARDRLLSTLISSTPGSQEIFDVVAIDRVRIPGSAAPHSPLLRFLLKGERAVHLQLTADQAAALTALLRPAAAVPTPGRRQ